MMKKIYFPLIAAAVLSFSACNNDDSGLFDTSAAERLEESRTEYEQLLTADGGLWALEYFTNDEEPGYVLTMQFGNNGAVEISADHKWIGSKFQQETSLWDVISDNGTVLTFNTYNTLFHVFSTPENIVGSDAPKNEFGEDINELGYGHEGDYEFLLMSHDQEGNIRLVGKKHGKEAWLRKLDASVDPQEYLNEIKAKRNIFSSKFPDFILTEPSGATYTVNNLGAGIPSIFPRDFNGVEADPVTQTVTAHGVLTAKGFRFREPLEIKRADDSTFEIEELLWQEDGSLSCPAAAITGPTAKDALTRTSLTWTLDPESLTGSLAEAYNKANEALVAYSATTGGYSSITLNYASFMGNLTPVITFNVGKRVCRDYVNIDFTADYAATLSLLSSTDASKRYEELVPEYATFKQALLQSFDITKASVLDPSKLTFTAKDGGSVTFIVK
ncbi:MAG: DUF4302 domain-containing protein [Bacteroides sp.]|nr:DUF4302 domain-containing protein [Bacteroides sp.]